MKKLFLAVALVMGLGTSVAFANNMVSDVEIATMINEFKPIDVKELPQAVQDAIKENLQGNIGGCSRYRESGSFQ